MTGSSYGRVVVNFSDCSKVNEIFENEIRKYSNYFTHGIGGEGAAKIATVC